jgi:hypothetical protein
VSVDLPASGWEMTAKVRRRDASRSTGEAEAEAAARGEVMVDTSPWYEALT